MVDVERFGWWRSRATEPTSRTPKTRPVSAVRMMLRSAGSGVADVTARLAGQAGKVIGLTPERQSSELVSLRSDAGFAGHVDRANHTADLATLADQPSVEPQMFALVDASDPTKIYFHGIDTGNGAFTVSGSDGPTNFGKWMSMQSAFERLDMMTGPHVQLALVMFDSLPVMAVAPLPLGWPRQPATLGPAAVAELEAPAAEHDS